MQAEFCEDEGCPHYGSDHVCINNDPLQSDNYSWVQEAIRGMSKPRILGKSIAYIFLDECSYNKPWDIEPSKPQQHIPDWKHPIPTLKDHGSSAPSDTTRAKLRAKRKKRK